MSKIKKEKLIKKQQIPISIKGLKKIIFQIENCNYIFNENDKIIKLIINNEEKEIKIDKS